MDVDEEDSFDHVKEQQKSWVTKAVEETDVRPEPVPRYAIVLAGAESLGGKLCLEGADLESSNSCSFPSLFGFISIRWRSEPSRYVFDSCSTDLRTRPCTLLLRSYCVRTLHTMTQQSTGRSQAVPSKLLLPLRLPL